MIKLLDEHGSDVYVERDGVVWEVRLTLEGSPYSTHLDFQDAVSAAIYGDGDRQPQPS